MAQNYGYETLMTELPTYMKQVLRFSIKTVSSLVRGQWFCDELTLKNSATHFNGTTFNRFVRIYPGYYTNKFHNT
jgi:hypothetical protein